MYRYSAQKLSLSGLLPKATDVYPNFVTDFVWVL